MSYTTKYELRKCVFEEMEAFTQEYIDYSNNGLFMQVTSLKEFEDASAIMIFYSVDREPDTLEIAKAAFAAGKTVTFPYCYKHGIMEAREVKSLSEMKPAILNIPAPPNTAPVVAPENLDLIIVPALTYDTNGYRLGYGGGYYDRYLLKTPAFTVGITRQKLMRDEVPREPHDVAVNCVVTEEKIIATSR
jgi:5-formyltetrahydrofolate cyclo-ligase